MVYIPGVRMACVRLFQGVMQRESFEPKVTEFVSGVAP
jgi:hypothetical protein